jgi:hypothetical protein
MFAAKVTGGVIVPDGPEPLQEGAAVSVLASDGEASFTASPSEEAALLEALSDERRPLPLADVLDRLR